MLSETALKGQLLPVQGPPNGLLPVAPHLALPLPQWF
jgi:hypothetical protein